MTRSLTLGVLMLALPSVAWACAGCVSSAFGDRTFGWAYLTLIVAPFVIGSGIAGVMAYYYRTPRDKEETRAVAARRAPRALDKETT